MKFLLGLYFCLFISPTLAADSETTLLIIEGNLIDRVDLINKDSSPDVVISAHYDLLPDFVKTDISARQILLENLLPSYEVAYLAADSAEMAEVRDKINIEWGKIHTIHMQFFNTNVVTILNNAYVKKFKGLLPENSNP